MYARGTCALATRTYSLQAVLVCKIQLPSMQVTLGVPWRSVSQVPVHTVPLG
jgi:hypothetical protein